MSDLSIAGCMPYCTTPILPFNPSPFLFLSTGCNDILPRAMGEDLTVPTWGSGTPSVPGRWSSLPNPPPPPVQHCRQPHGCTSVPHPRPPPQLPPPPCEVAGCVQRDTSAEGSTYTYSQLTSVRSIPPHATLLLPSTDSRVAGRVASTSNNKCTTALGGVCPACRPRGWGGCEVRLRPASP